MNGLELTRTKPKINGPGGLAIARERRMANRHNRAKKLTHREIAFINAYITNGWNATRAAASAGYKSPAMSGHVVKNTPRIALAISNRLDEAGLDVAHLLARLSEVVKCSISDFCDDTGKVVWTKVQEKGHLVKKRKLKVTRERLDDGSEDGTIETEECELELHDPLTAIEKLLKVHGAYKENAPQINIQSTGTVQFVVGINAEELP